MTLIHIYLYTTWFLILLPGFIALGDKTEIEVMTTRVASRFPLFVFNASIAISNIEDKWKVKSCIQWIYWKCLKIPGMHIRWGIVFLNSKMYGQKLSKKINRKGSNKNFTAKRVLLVPI